MAEVLQRLGAADVRVKWPNDLYLNDRKLAGILVELTGNRRCGSTGHRCRHQPGDADTNASAITRGWINLQEAGIQIDRNELAATLLNELRQSLKQFEIDGLAPFIGRWRTSITLSTDRSSS